MQQSTSRLVGRFAAVLAVLVVTTFVTSGVALAQGFEEGRNYLRLKTPQPVETGNKIEVIEFFSYGCPHCAHLEPELQPWIKSLPPDVSFRRVPVLFQPAWANLAKIYYTLGALDIEQRLTPEVFSAIHEKGINLSNDKTFLDWIATKGVDRKKAEDMFASFAIVGKVNKAKSQAQAYRIDSVPTLIVDGKFVTGSDKVGNLAQMPAALNFLIAKARSERPKT